MFAILGAVAATALLLGLALYAHYLFERRAVRAFALTAVRDVPRASTVDVVLRLASHVHFQIPRQPDDPPFLLDVCAPLGATRAQS